MAEFEFILRFTLPDDLESETLEERLSESGCDDALLGLGRRGQLVLAFTREASSSETAFSSAIKDVQVALPEATLMNSE